MECGREKRPTCRSETHPLYCELTRQTVTNRSNQLLQPVIHEGHLNGQGFRFAIVASRWNDFISARLVDGALDALERLGTTRNWSRFTKSRRF